MDRFDFFARNLVNEPKGGGRLIPFIPNAAQCLIFAEIQKQINAGVPVKLIIYKARQLGSSTGIAGWYYTDCLYQPNINAIIAAHDDEASWGIYRKYKRFYDYSPTKPRTDYSSRKELIFSAPHNSRIVVQTAGRTGLGRADTYQYAHLSEVAYWPSPTDTMLAVQQTIPDSPGTCEIWESTGNGVGGLFYDAWQESVEYRRKYPERLDGFTPVFLPWTLDPEYCRPVPEGVQVELIEGLTADQCYWRERTIAEKCQGDVELFKQEYPLTPDEGFRTSGSAVFAAGTILKYRKLCRPGRFVHIVQNGGIAPAETRTNCWELWEQPSPNRQYVVAADVAEGKLSDRQSERSDRDYSAAVVFDRHDLSVVAIWHGRIETHAFGKALLSAAHWYNQAWATPEINGPGLAVLNVLKEAGYEKTYIRRSPDERLDEDDTANYGWKTTTVTRQSMTADLIRALNEPGLKIYSDKIVDEMQTFVRDSTGKPIHLSGKHDDLLFALMIALQLHLRCPGKSQFTLPESTGQMEQEGPVADPAYAYVGGRDEFNPAEDEEESAWMSE